MVNALVEKGANFNQAMQVGLAIVESYLSFLSVVTLVLLLLLRGTVITRWADFMYRL